MALGKRCRMFAWRICNFVLISTSYKVLRATSPSPALMQSQHLATLKDTVFNPSNCHLFAISRTMA
jgi:hypothetical protein